MARSPFPTGDFGRNSSPNPVGGAIGAPAAGAAAGLADAVQGFGQRVRKMAEASWTREGEADAARVIEASAQSGIAPQIRSGRGVDDEAYNTVIRGQQLAQRQAAYMAEAQKAEIANPDSETRYAEAITAVGAAFAPTGDAYVDTQFERFRTIENAQGLGRVRTKQEAGRQETVRGAYVETAATAGTALGQAIASAGLDDPGAKLVGAALTQFADQIVRFGPREAFSIGGVEFAADPSRAGVVGADKLASDFQTAQVDARINWILAAGERAPGSMAKLAFAGQVQERWAAKDPMFTGLDAGDMARLTGRLEADASRAATDERAQVTAAAAQARDLLTALEYGGDVDPAELRALATASGDPGLAAQVDYRLTYGFKVSPNDKTDNGGGMGAGFDGAADVLLDRLEGSGFVANDGGRGRSQWGVTEKSHPEFWADGKIDRSEAKQVARSYWDGIGGDTLPPDLAMAALAAAYVGGIETAKGFLAQANGDVDQFLALEEARFRRLAGNDTAKLNGWLARQGKVRAAIGEQAAQRRSAEGYASDPIGFARGNRTRPALATVPEFDPNAVFGDGVGAWGAAMRSRRATGRELARRDGVPARMLASEEVAFYKAEFERRPEAVVQFATASALALGGAAARDLLGELSRGGVAGPDLHLAWLATEGSTRNIADKVVQGRSLRAGGAKDVTFAKGDDIAAVTQKYASALAMQPELFAVVQATARDMAIADAARGQLQSAEAYVNSALGATRSGGKTYGGLARVNGADTLAPTWLRNDYLDDALEIAATAWAANGSGPLYSNGQPIPVRVLRGYTLKATPAGTYRLVNTAGEEIPARSGRAFEFNIEAEAFRDVLRRRLPGAVLGSN